MFCLTSRPRAALARPSWTWAAARARRSYGSRGAPAQGGGGAASPPPFFRRGGAGLLFVGGDGAASGPPASKRFDIALCLGASWIWGGYVGTLRGLLRLTAPGGRVLVGEPFWIRRPTRANLAVLGERADAFATHEGNQRLAPAARP